MPDETNPDQPEQPSLSRPPSREPAARARADPEPTPEPTPEPPAPTPPSGGVGPGSEAGN